MDWIRGIDMEFTREPFHQVEEQQGRAKEEKT
jgi:hypothetical protein